MNKDQALKPALGIEADIRVDDNKFEFSPDQLSKLLNPKSLKAFHALGGIAGLENGLRTSRQCGLSSNETVLNDNVSFEEVKAAATDKHSDGPFKDRKRIFKDNHLPAKRVKTIFRLMWSTYNDQVLILLTAVAIISLGVGLYQTFDTIQTTTSQPVGWIEGAAIITAIFIIVVVRSVNDYQKERQFATLYKRIQDRNTKVIRSGKSQEISVFNVLVGDVVHIAPGDVIPADGIFIDGYNVKCDESSAAGQSCLVQKHPADEVFRAIENHEDLTDMDPFIISGAKVVEGVGTFLVTATGVNSNHGKTLMSLRDDRDIVPLQPSINALSGYMAKFGGVAALLLFAVLLIEFLARLRHSNDTPTQKGQIFLHILMTTLTLVAIAAPKGLTLGVTFALAFATAKMLKDNNLVRQFKVYETMGKVTDICTDKTGPLAQNKMMVVAGTVGTSFRFVDKRGCPTVPRSNNSTTRAEQAASNIEVDGVPTDEFVRYLASDIKVLLEQSIVVNSTAFEGEKDGQQIFIGPKTEIALLTLARDYLGIGSVSVGRSNAEIVQLIPFNPTRKYMATVVKLSNTKYRLYVKGAPEILFRKCTRILRDPTKDTSDTEMTKDKTEQLDQVMARYASCSLRTIALLYRDFEKWPPGYLQSAETDAALEGILTDLVLLGVFGIQDPLRIGVREAVQACQKAGVIVRMITGDSVLTAKAIAEECGIISAGGKVIEGPEFRKLSISEMDLIIPQLRVLARSSPRDKQILVTRLKKLGKVVAVTGGGLDDSPALAAADVGFSMGISGTEVAKEASDIILMDDNFISIVKAIMWGRTVNDAVKKFLQFHVTISITTVMLTFISAVADSKEQSVLAPVQLMWVNLIQNVMAALALATDPPTPSILDRKPEPKSAPLITITMWKLIIGQAAYQLTVTLIIYFGRGTILSYYSDRERAQLPTLVFNTFVWMQIFNQFSNRRLDNKFNIFEGMFRNWFFIAVSLFMMGCQVMIVFVGGRALSAKPLNRAQWGYSIVLGALSILIGVIVRMIPVEPFEKRYQRFLNQQAPTTSDEEQQFQLPHLSEENRQDEGLNRVRG